jgi:hypothetical protein
MRGNFEHLRKDQVSALGNLVTDFVGDMGLILLRENDDGASQAAGAAWEGRTRLSFGCGRRKLLVIIVILTTDLFDVRSPADGRWRDVFRDLAEKTRAQAALKAMDPLSQPAPILRCHALQ